MNLSACLWHICLHDIDDAVRFQETISCREAMGLCGDVALCQHDMNSYASCGVDCGLLLLDIDINANTVSLCQQRLETATLAGLRIEQFRFFTCFDDCGCAAGETCRPASSNSLISLAIMTGDITCAELCGRTCASWPCFLPPRLDRCPLCRQGPPGRTLYVGTGSWCQPMVTSSVRERRAAAGAALRAGLALLRRRTACEKGPALCQAVRSHGPQGPFLLELVNAILDFVSDWPTWAGQFSDSELKLILASAPPPTGNQQTVAVTTAPLTRDDAGYQVAAREGAPEDAAPLTADDSGYRDAVNEDDYAEELPGQETKSNDDDLLTAVRDSRAELPPLSSDGVVVFRLLYLFGMHFFWFDVNVETVKC